jgi:acetyl esterase/lipase
MKTKMRMLFLFCAGLGAQQVLAQRILPDTTNVEYARANGISLKLDVYLPQNVAKPYPVIVWIHGGGWRGGSKENPVATFMVQQGYAVVSINYRLSNQAIFPAQIHDCKAAIRWIRANAAKYGFNSERLGAWGSSAGGHLVAMLGTAGDIDSLEGTVGGNLQFSSRVQAVCDWYGPANLLTICDFPSNLAHCSPTSPEALLIGGAIPNNLAKARAASPITYVSKNDPPFLIQHGTNDMTVPFHQSVELDSALRANGVSVKFNPIVGAGHGGAGFSADSTRRRVSDFFDRHLKTATAIREQQEITPTFRLQQNYPNPFRSGAAGNLGTAIRFSLPQREHVTLKVFDALGREVMTLVDAELNAGEHAMALTPRDWVGGIYFYSLTAGKFSETRKALLMK